MGDRFFGFHMDWIEEWSQFFGGCNWYTFRPILIEFEDDRIMGGVELTVVVLGLGFRLRYNHTETDEWQEIVRRADEVRSEYGLRPSIEQETGG